MKQTAIPLTDEEKANMQLLEITGGILTGVTDPNKLIGSLVLPEGITEIGTLVFADCSGLKCISIPNSMKVIGDSVFSDCTGLARIGIPNSVTEIGDYVFSGCTCLTELTVDRENPVYCSANNILYTKNKKHLIVAAGGLKGHIVLPDGVTGIAEAAFLNCRSLTGVHIPVTVTRIGINAFSRCTNLINLTVDSANPVYYSEDNSIYTKNTKHLIAAAGGLKGHIVLPNGVTGIGYEAFADCTALTGVTIPATVTRIAHQAFIGCSSLTNVRIPDSVTKIDDYAFFGCTHLTELTVDNENPVYCSENNILYTKDKTRLIAAAGGLKGRVVLPDTVTEIADYSFRDCCFLTSVNIPCSVTRINDCAFSGCTGLTELNVDSENPIYYSENNILYTKDKKCLIAAAGGLKGHVVIPDGVTEIADYAFSDCRSLTSVSMPCTVTRIGNCAFSGCTGLIGISIPDGVTEIDYEAFADCTALTDVRIPSNVTWIGDESFSGCTNLKTVIIESSIIKTIKDNAFENVHADIHFTVKTDAVKAMLKKNTAIRDEQITVAPSKS